MNAAPRRLAIGWLLVAVHLGCGSCSDGHGARPMDSVPVGAETRRVEFTASDDGQLPTGWIAARTGGGTGSQWMVTEDASSPQQPRFVMAQVAKSPRSTFNLCVFEDAVYRDVRIAVELKVVDGKSDQGGGVVWRYLDANNYYVCRFNPLEDNLRIYKVIAGTRHQLASVDVSLRPDPWQHLSASMQGNRIICTVAETELTVRDDTLTDPGHIGLWTKADACTYFDELMVSGLNELDIRLEAAASKRADDQLSDVAAARQD